MEERIRPNEEQVELDLGALAMALWKKAWLIGLGAVICALAVLLGSVCFVQPKYRSEVMFYVHNSAAQVEADISSADVNASRDLVKSCIVILQTRQTMELVRDHTGVEEGSDVLLDSISAQSVDATEIFCVTVTAPDPEWAKEVAEGIAAVLPGRVADIMEGIRVKIVEYPEAAADPSSPDLLKNGLLGALLGVCLTAAWVAIGQVRDAGIRKDAAHPMEERR